MLVLLLLLLMVSRTRRTIEFSGHLTSFSAMARTHTHTLSHTHLFAVNKEALRLLSPDQSTQNLTWRARNDFDLDRRIEREKKHL